MTKAGRLVEAKANGLMVPPFVIVESSVSDGMLDKKVAELLRSFDSSITHFSVRSSALVEDGDEQSFAGQFETFLYVTREELVEKVRVCRASATSDRVRHYAKVDQPTTIEVIIQEMIDADMSGVAFSANPNGMLNEAVIAVGAGAGAVVDDATVTTTYFYHLDDNVYYHDQNDDALCLQDVHVRDIIALLRACMERYGRYIDIEFAVKDSTIWLLQVRPITTLKTDDLVVFDDHNIAESYPGVSTPLTQSFVTEAYTGIFRQLLVRSIGRASAARYDSVLNQMVRAVNGRMYYQVSSWYTVLGLLPFRKKFLAIWQEMVGVDMTSIVRDVRPTFFERCKVIWAIMTGGIVLPRRMRRLHETFRRIEASFRQKSLQSLSVQELLEEYDRTAAAILADWDVTLANDLYAFLYTGLYKRIAGTDAELRSDKELPSTRLIYAYDKLAKKWQEAGDSEDFRRALHDYCEEFGDRVPGELKLETETFRQNPELLVQQLSGHVAMARHEQKASPRQGFLARYFHKRASLGTYNRELSRLDRAKIFGMVRDIMLQIGVVMTEQGALQQARDVFYLTLADIRSYKDGDTLHDIVATRRLRYEQLQTLPTYSHLVFQKGAIVEKQIYGGTDYTWHQDDAPLVGVPCSPGRVEGEAVVVTTLDTSLKLEGKILVAETTDPGWGLLLTQAKGIVAERGSLLSHTAIVSRELGKPSVVGVEAATRRIRKGDRLRVDGSTGVVEILG